VRVIIKFIKEEGRHHTKRRWSLPGGMEEGKGKRERSFVSRGFL
jgi:hypothetical protein